MSENKKEKRPSIRELIEAQINLIQAAVFGEKIQDLVDTAKKIFANLPIYEIKDDDPICFTVNPDVGLVVKKEQSLYYLWHDFTIRVKIIHGGTFADVFKKGQIVSSDVTPPAN